MITIHEIDNDGRGPNTWEVSADGKYLFSTDSFVQAVDGSLYLAKKLATTVTIYTIEWYEKENQ